MTKISTPKEWKIFKNNYADFCNILKYEDGLLPHLVDKGIISTDDVDEVRSKSVIQKGSTLLRHISGPLETGRTRGFYGLLEVMREHGKPDTQKFAREILQKSPRSSSNGEFHNSIALLTS